MGLPLRVNDALGYLDHVKKIFKDQPGVYKSFLDIMKQFKSKAIGTEGVIDRVQKLFQGHDDLILGFNRFLPPGYEMRVGPIVPPVVQYIPPPIQTQPVAVGQTVPDAQTIAAARAAAPLPPPKPTVEFNHAVNYVAKIKTRYASTPAIYEHFLQILHVYQENRNSEPAIERVKAQIKELFAADEDLRDEFNYFLPESAQTPIRRRKQRKQTDTKSPVGRKLANRVPSNLPSLSTTLPAGMRKEIAAIEAIKFGVPRTLYVQFLRLLHLTSMEVISRACMITLLEDIFAAYGEGRYNDYLQKFKDVLEFDDWEESKVEADELSNYYSFIANVPLNSCDIITTSYRILPEEVPLLPRSGKTVLGDQVLCDNLVSIPSGHEDQTFLATRKNEFEEALFRVEDERFELDRLIEGTDDVLEALLHVQKLLETLPMNDAYSFDIEGSLKTLHVYSIARLYGDQWWDVLYYLKENPLRSVPVIIERLKEKSEEWKIVRRQQKLPWRKLLQHNESRSKDHRSFYFKTDDRKRLVSRSFIVELKDANVKYVEGRAAAAEFKDDAEVFTHCLEYKFDDASMRSEMFEILSVHMMESYSDEDFERIEKFWTVFTGHFFGDSGDEIIPKHDTRPLRVMMETWAFQEKVNPVRRHTQTSRLFYGNYSFFVFFRLYELLFDRLTVGYNLAKNLGSDTVKQYWNLLKKLFRGDIILVDFEDKIRELLGAQAYVLFTLDKLVAMLVKQLDNLSSDESNQKLVALYFYEYERSRDDMVPHTLQKSALLARMYLSNCSALLTDSHSCVQIEYFPETRAIQYGLVENLLTPEPKNVTEEWSTYLEEYLSSMVPSSVAEPFLKRSKVADVGNGIVVTHNGLESKLDLKTFKVHYVEETEDSFIRLGKKRSLSVVYGKHSESFNQLLQAHGN